MQGLIKSAFDNAELDYTILRSANLPADKQTLIAEYIDAHSCDRRFKLHWLAAGIGDKISALVRYRGVKYHVYPDYLPGSIFNGYIVERA